MVFEDQWRFYDIRLLNEIVIYDMSFCQIWQIKNYEIFIDAYKV